MLEMSEHRKNIGENRETFKETQERIGHMHTVDQKWRNESIPKESTTWHVGRLVESFHQNIAGIPQTLLYQTESSR